MLNNVKKYLSELKSLCIKYEVKTMYLFGSATSDSFRADSDIDILISFKEIPFGRYSDNYFNLHAELEKLFARKVDLVTERSLTNPYFIKNIAQSKELLYAA